MQYFYKQQKGFIKSHLIAHSTEMQELKDCLINHRRVFSTLINVIDPYLIAVGAGIGNINLLYTEGYEIMKKRVSNDGRITTPIGKPVLGDSAGVYVAASLWGDLKQEVVE